MSDNLELSIIATVLQEGTPEAFRIVGQQLRPEHFQTPRYRYAWKVLEELAGKGWACNLNSLAKAWTSKTHERPGLDFDTAIDRESFPSIGLCVAMGVPELVENYLKLATNELIQTYTEGKLSPSELKEALEKVVCQNTSIVARKSSREVLDDFIKHATDPKAAMSAGSPFEEASLLTMEYGMYVIVGARPSVGKTALSMNYLSHFARKDQCLYVSCEMSSRALMRRFTASCGSIPMEDLKSPCEAIAKQIEAFGEKEIHNRIRWADFSAGKCYVEDVVGMIDDSARTQGTKVVILDYIQQVHSKEKFTRRRDEVATISAQLKRIGKKHNLVLVVLAQLKRAEAAHRHRLPRMDDLSECCDLEQDADQIILVHRSYKEKDGKYKDEGRLIVAKARDSATGSVDVCFEPRYCRFSIPELPHSVEEEDEDPFQ